MKMKLPIWEPDCAKPLSRLASCHSVKPRVYTQELTEWSLLIRFKNFLKFSLPVSEPCLPLQVSQPSVKKMIEQLCSPLDSLTMEDTSFST